MQFQELLSNVFLYGATFFLGLTLGVLCEAGTLLDPVVLKLLVLGMLALLIADVIVLAMTAGILGLTLKNWLTKGTLATVARPAHEM